MSRLLALIVFTCHFLAAQFEPESAHVLLYFPQLADGGDRAQSWETSFIFHNSHQIFAVDCSVNLYNDSGRALSLDLGTGSSSVHRIRIPPLGRRTLRSRIASSSIVTGWAIGSCSLPVQATVLFRAIESGRPVVELSAPPSLPSHRFRFPANGDLGIAVANVYSAQPVQARVTTFDTEGRVAGSRTFSLCALCHSSFTLRSFIPALPPGFEGSVVIEAENPAAYLTSWALNAERGLLSSLPAGGSAWPISHWDRIWLTYQKVLSGAKIFYPGLNFSNIRLQISSEAVVNARAFPNGEIEVTLALSQLISDSPGELAFVLAHELGHQIQFQTRQLQLRGDNVELDADAIATLFLLASGYDPYSGAGAFGKLMMASGRSGLLSQLFDDLLDPHTSFSNRIGQVIPLLEMVCGTPEGRDLCSQYKAFAHPNLPSSLPLLRPPISLPE